MLTWGLKLHSNIFVMLLNDELQWGNVLIAASGGIALQQRDGWSQAEAKVEPENSFRWARMQSESRRYSAIARRRNSSRRDGKSG